jgi:tellurite resistance protein TerB
MPYEADEAEATPPPHPRGCRFYFRMTHALPRRIAPALGPRSGPVAADSRSGDARRGNDKEIQMALWDRIKDSAQTMQTQLVAKKNDLKSGAFRDASMAMCALVAAADGSIDPAERRRVAQLIGTNEVLQNFPADDLQRRFDAYLDKLTADFDFGKVSVMQEIGKVKKKPVEARAVIQIGIVIGGADGDFDKTEQAVVREVCFALDITPAEFDL